jgi:antitoxin component of MazEF toxin-antitoxin module
MTIVVKSKDEKTISLPASLLKRLRLREGDEIKAILDGQTLRLSKLEDFLSLRGALAEDAEFDAAMEMVDKAWQSWTLPTSV